jgi:hypothetical protein
VSAREREKEPTKPASRSAGQSLLVIREMLIGTRALAVGGNRADECEKKRPLQRDATLLLLCCIRCNLLGTAASAAACALSASIRQQLSVHSPSVAFHHISAITRAK